MRRGYLIIFTNQFYYAERAGQRRAVARALDSLVRSVFINISAVTDSQNQNLLFKNGEDDAVVAYTQFPETGKRPFKKRIIVGSHTQFFLDLVENTPCLRLAKPG